jgi:thiol-disulfide isomerase/thioredoxin
MSKTQSVMLPLGTKAPLFKLKDVTTDTLFELSNNSVHKGTVVMFICNHCPYVKHINKVLIEIANQYIARDIQFIAISSNDVENYPDDSPEYMKIVAKQYHYPFLYLYDETQEVAKAYHAACTPDFYVFDKGLSLVYRGQLDDSRPGNNIPVSGKSLSMALDCIINNKPVDLEQKPSLGCNIKWKE